MAAPNPPNPQNQQQQPIDVWATDKRKQAVPTRMSLVYDITLK